jgi:ubiquinone/menaquinone biosynthesis C-methylase UbiE
MPPDPPPKKTDYFIDATSGAEMTRLINQDRLITEAMGGLFSERSDIDAMHAILDLGCGPGQWVLDVAYEYPKIAVTGIDICNMMIEYARAHARVQGLDNAHFQVMDITKPLEFGDNSFDLVNGRLIAFLSPEQWTGLLRECMRIVRPGGVIRLTENEVVTTSLATDTAFSLFYRALTRAGQSFSPTGHVLGITSRLSNLLKKAGCTNIQYRAHALDFSAGAAVHETFCKVISHFLILMQPFLIGTAVTTQEELESLLYQVEVDMYSDDFSAVMFLLTVWGEKAQDA